MTEPSLSPEDTINDEPSSGLALVVADVTDMGCKRANNEDAVRSEVAPDAQSAVVVLADGMGGQSAGELASAALIERLMIRQSSGQLESGDDIVSAVLDADEFIAREYPGSGTTAVVVIANTRQVTVGHVGDSRAYLFRENRLDLLTKDQSWVQLQVDLGRLSEEEARLHPRRNVLLQAVGTGKKEEPSLKTLRFWPGDMILLCSDGLSGVLRDEEMLRILRASDPDNPGATSSALVQAALDEGAPDNVTVALLALRETGN